MWFLPDNDKIKREIAELKSRAGERSKRFTERTELKPSIPGIPDLNIGFKTLPLNRLNTHILFQGITRCGKTYINDILLKSVIEGRLGYPKNIIVLDSKGDNIPWSQPLCERLGIKYNLIKRKDPQSSCLDIARMIDGDKLYMRELAKILIPVPRNSEPFWALTAQGLLVQVMQALDHKMPNQWGFHDLYDACLRNIATFNEFLSTTPDGEQFVKRYFPENQGKDTQYGIIAEMSSKIEELQPIADLQRVTPRSRWITAKDMISDEPSYTVVSGEPKAKEALSPVVRFLFYVLTQEIASLPEPGFGGKKKLIWLSIDELPYWGNLKGIDQMLQFNPSRGARVSLTFQDIEQVVNAFGPHRAKAIANMCGIQLYFCALGDAAVWASRQLGKRRFYEETVSYSRGSSSVSEHMVERTALSDYDLNRLPIADEYDGIYYYIHTLSNYGELYKCRIPASTIDAYKPKVDLRYRRDVEPSERTQAHKDPIDLGSLHSILDLLNKEEVFEEYMSLANERNPLDRELARGAWKMTQGLIDSYLEALYKFLRSR